MFYLNKILRMDGINMDYLGLYKLYIDTPEIVPTRLKIIVK